MKTLITTATTALILVLAANNAVTGEQVKKGIFTSADQVVFDDIIPGIVAFATVSGDREKGAHGTFVRIPAGEATPLHTHGAGYQAVVIQGNFENPIVGNKSSDVTLGAGSYYSVPAGAKHITRCAADSPVPCISYFYQTVPFDFAVAN